MRFYKNKSKVGDFRIITKFLFKPVTIQNETRWLERVDIVQILTDSNKWENICFFKMRIIFIPMGKFVSVAIRGTESLVIFIMVLKKFQPES